MSCTFYPNKNKPSSNLRALQEQLNWSEHPFVNILVIIISCSLASSNFFFNQLKFVKSNYLRKSHFVFMLELKRVSLQIWIKLLMAYFLFLFLFFFPIFRGMVTRLTFLQKLSSSSLILFQSLKLEGYETSSSELTRSISLPFCSPYVFLYFPKNLQKHC